MDTKSCNLTEVEIKEVMRHHGLQLYPDSVNFDEAVERIKYLSSRLKAFGENKGTQVATETEVKNPPEAKGWGTN